MKAHKLTPRETVQIIAALRYVGRTIETGLPGFTPDMHPMCKARFKEHLPLTLDELETLIGRLDGSFTGRGLRQWDGWRWL
jgi:hypothetical protein